MLLLQSRNATSNATSNATQESTTASSQTLYGWFVHDDSIHDYQNLYSIRSREPSYHERRPLGVCRTHCRPVARANWRPGWCPGWRLVRLRSHWFGVSWVRGLVGLASRRSSVLAIGSVVSWAVEHAVWRSRISPVGRSAREDRVTPRRNESFADDLRLVCVSYSL